MTTRRTFLRLAAAAGAALGITRYAEPMQIVPDALARHEWIEDRGDFYVVRVPDFKTFARETLNKPTIFLLGTQAVVSDVAVSSYANLHVPRGGRVQSCLFDSQKSEAQGRRSTVVLAGKDITFEGNEFRCRANTDPSCLEVAAPLFIAS